MHFWDPSQWDKMWFEYQIIKFQWKKWVKMFTFAYGQGREGWPSHPPPPSPPMVSLTIKKNLFLTTSLKKNTTSYMKMNRDHSINFQSWEDMQSKINVEKKFKGINLEPLNVDQVAGTAPGPLLEIRCDKAHNIPIAQCVLRSVRCPCIFYGPVFTTRRRRGRY